MSRAKAKRPARNAALRAREMKHHIEAQRRRLLGADAVVMSVRYALDSRTGGLDELRVMDALQVASDIINDAVAALEQRHPGAAHR